MYASVIWPQPTIRSPYGVPVEFWLSLYSILHTQYSLVFYSSEPPCLLCLPLVNVPTCQLASSSAAFLPTGQLINRST